MPGLNRVLNMLEQFVKVDDIVTPLRLLKVFLDDVLVDKTVGYTKMHSH